MKAQDNPQTGGDQASRRLVLVSNRLPVVAQREAGVWRVERSAGGLVAAMDPTMRWWGGIWIGWPGISGVIEQDLLDTLAGFEQRVGYRLASVSMTRKEIDGFYYGFSNQIIWPLFHNQLTACNFDARFWRTYCKINRRFAQAAAQASDGGDFIWVHDYHLMNVASELRKLGIDNRIGFFNHIPFPTPDIFTNLPWWKKSLQALLAYDFIGLQTVADRDNLLACLEHLFAGVEVSNHGRCREVEIRDQQLPAGKRCIGIGALPIGIDYDTVVQTAGSDQAESFLRRYRTSWTARQIALGVDRLDYTKGLPHKLKAFGFALERYPELRSSISLVQHVLPSRERVPDYARQRGEIEQMVGEINGRFTDPGWVPIHYLYHSMKQSELMAYYRVAGIALVTSLKDGMNLVSKEYCAANINEDGVLILSEFAGSAKQLGGQALLINPYDTEGTAERIYQAYCMGLEERRRRMRSLRKIVRESNVYDWVTDFLNAADTPESGESVSV